jgi:hypothetical protein
MRVDADLIAAEFESADALLAAVKTLHAHGIAGIESYSPFGVPGMTDQLNPQRSRLPAIVFTCGLVGAVLSYGIQWFANVVDYPVNAGGRPAHAVLAFIPATFEGTVLFAALGAFFGLLWTLRLPKLWHPLFEIDEFERVTIDRYWVSLDLARTTLTAGEARMALQRLAPRRVVRVRARP